MKDMNQAMTGAMQTINSAKNAPQATHAVDSQIDAVLSELAKQLRDIRPAWKQALPTTESVKRWKAQMRQAMEENGIHSLAQIERCLIAARADDSAFWPSIGQIVNWCLGVNSNDDQIRAAFDRCRSKQPYADDIEYAAWLDVGFECRRLPIGKDFELFKTVYLRKLAMAQRGERLPSRNVKMIANEAPSARDYVEDEINKRLADGNRPLTSIEQRMAALRQQNRTKGRGETFKYRRAANAR